MDEIKLPHHVVNRFQRRWTARFVQVPGGRPQPVARCWPGNDDPLRSPQARRLLERSLRPPKADRTLEFDQPDLAGGPSFIDPIEEGRQAVLLRADRVDLGRPV